MVLKGNQTQMWTDGHGECISVKILQLLRDCEIWWSSTHLMVDWILTMLPVCVPCTLASSCSNHPRLSNYLLVIQIYPMPALWSQTQQRYVFLVMFRKWHWCHTKCKRLSLLNTPPLCHTRSPSTIQLLRSGRIWSTSTHSWLLILKSESRKWRNMLANQSTLALICLRFVSHLPPPDCPDFHIINSSAEPLPKDAVDQRKLSHRWCAKDKGNGFRCSECSATPETITGLCWA